MPFLLKKYKKILPTLLLLVSFCLFFFNYNYIVFGNLFGFSILVSLSFLDNFFDRTNNIIVRLSPFFLIIINIVDIIGVFLSYKIYSFLYFSAFILISLCVIILTKTKRLWKPYLQAKYMK